MAGADEANLGGTCEKCQREVSGTRRWIFSASCLDISGSRYVSFFDESGCKLLGATADELAPMKAEDPAAFDRYVAQRAFTRVVMRCTAKSDTYNEETRLKINCNAFTPIDYRAEAAKLLGEIGQMRAGGPPGPAQLPTARALAY